MGCQRRLYRGQSEGLLSSGRWCKRKRSGSPGRFCVSSRRTSAEFRRHCEPSEAIQRSLSFRGARWREPGMTAGRFWLQKTAASMRDERPQDTAAACRQAAAVDLLALTIFHSVHQRNSERDRGDLKCRSTGQSKTPGGYPPGVLLCFGQTNWITSCAERAAAGAACPGPRACRWLPAYQPRERLRRWPRYLRTSDPDGCR